MLGIRNARIVALLLAGTACPTFADAQSATTEPSIAQDATSETPAVSTPADESSVVSGTGDIVVTARKRDERLEDVPATIAVVGEQKLQTLQPTNATDLNGVVPGLVVSTALGGSPGVTFRGLGSNAAIPSIESSVAFFADGVYYSRPRDYLTPLYDLDRIEFVKGTQGTLLGKNTTLGAISAVTHRPQLGQLHYGAVSSYDFVTNTPRVEAYLNVPLGDTLAVRLSGLAANDHGYVTNVTRGKGPDTRDASGRIALAWEPTSDLSVYASYQHDDRRQRGTLIEVVRDARAGTTIASRAASIGLVGFEATGNDRNYSGANAFGTIPAGKGVYDDNRADRANLVANYKLGDYTITSQTAYNRYGGGYLSDSDQLPVNFLTQDSAERNKAFTQEVRLFSPTDRPVSFLLGGFYFWNSFQLDRTAIGYAPFPSNGTAITNFSQSTHSVSGFGQLTGNATDKLSASLGLRYTHETKDGTVQRLTTGGTLIGANPFIPRTTQTNTENNLDGDVTIQYKITPRNQIYLSGSRASKSGGFQPVPATLAGFRYSGEKAETVELGGKFAPTSSTNLDVALFNTTVSNFQLTRQAPVGTPPLVQSVIDNVDVRSRGVEMNGAWRVSSQFRVSAGVVYADSIFTQTLPAMNPVVVDGGRQPRAPKWSGNIDANFSQPVGDHYALTLDGSAQLSSKQLLQVDTGSTAGAPIRDALARFDLRLGFGDQDAGWNLALVGRNLTDVRQPIFVISTIGTGVVGTNTQAYAGSLMPPRTIALQLTVRR